MIYRRKPVSRARRRRRKGVNVGVLIVSAIFAVVIGISLFIIISGKKRPEVIYPDTTAADAATEPLESVDDGRSYYTVTIASDQIYYGDLILVNAATEYRFPAEAENSIVNISEYKNEYYLMADPAARLSKNVVDRFNTLCTDYYAYNGFHCYMQVDQRLPQPRGADKCLQQLCAVRRRGLRESVCGDPGIFRAPHGTGA